MAVDARGSIGAAAMGTSRWRDPHVRSLIYQIGSIAIVAIVVAYFAHNAAVNMARQGIAAGFGFLNREAGFEISSSLISYTPADT